MALILLIVFSVEAKAQTDFECGAYILWREARSEGLLTQRSVMDVVINRTQDGRLSICEVARKPGAFPYMAGGVRPVDKKFKVRYKFVMRMQPVLPPAYKYFNHIPHSFGVKTRKIGRLYFAQ